MNELINDQNPTSPQNEGKKRSSFLPFRLGNKGGANWELSEAKCGGKNSGGFDAECGPRGVVADPPLSNIGRKFAAPDEEVVEWLGMIQIDGSLISNNLNQIRKWMRR